MDDESQRATFTAMADARPEEWVPVAIAGLKHQADQADRVLEHLRLLAGDHGGYAVDRLTHSLQTATLAHQDGRDEEYVVCALLHDIGDTLGSFNHPDIAAAILKPFVSEANLWMCSTTASSRATTSSTTSAWTATCASNSAATSISRGPRSSARFMTTRRSTPRPKR